jgi:16S rRNA (uracil1498-N3)-methyltransferase
MQLFFQEKVSEPVSYLNEEESKHLIRVLRKKQGDSIRLTDGKGMIYESVILDANPKKAGLKILNKSEAAEDDFYIHLAIAPTKNPDRMEWMVEKITEIGFHELTLMETINSERSFLKTDRLQKKIISACKQSLKFRTPILNPTTQFNTLIHSSDFSDYQKFIAYVSTDEIPHLINLALPKNKYILLIGPEGDFDQKEIKEALDAGFRAVSLGKSRLRTETAGLSGVHILQLLNEK